MDKLLAGFRQRKSAARNSISESMISSTIPSGPDVRINFDEFEFEASSHLLTKILTSTSVRSLYLFSRKGTSTTDWVNVARLLKHQNSLQVLQLVKCQLFDSGLTHISHQLATINCSQLHTLHLGSNNIGPTGVRSLARALKQQKTPVLHTLDLSRNCLGDDGLIVLYEELCTSLPSLRGVDLSSNNIGNKGAFHGLALWFSNPTSSLQNVNLYGNTIGDYGAGVLVASLKKNKQLHHLNLSFNLLSDSGASLFVRLLKVNVNLETILLASNQIWDDIQHKIRVLLQKNRTIRLVLIVSSARVIPRLGKRSSVKRLPKELLRMVCSMLKSE